MFFRDFRRVKNNTLNLRFTLIFSSGKCEKKRSVINSIEYGVRPWSVIPLRFHLTKAQINYETFQLSTDITSETCIKVDIYVFFR
jgi:hypothetical protein